MREVATVREVEAQNRVARLQHRGVCLHVGLRSGMGLDVRMLGAKQLLGAVARQVFDHVGILAAAVVALAGISLGVLVREHRSRGFEHGFADEVFRGNQLEALVLAAGFVVNGGGDLWIGFGQRTVHLGSCHVVSLEVLDKVSYTSGR